MSSSSYSDLHQQSSNECKHRDIAFEQPERLYASITLPLFYLPPAQPAPHVGRPSTEPKAPLILLMRRPNPLDQRITCRTIKLLHAINQIQRRHQAIVAEIQLGSLAAVVIYPRPVREVRRRIIRECLIAERPWPPPVPRVRVPPNARVLDSVLDDVDHIVVEEMPVAALVSP